MLNMSLWQKIVIIGLCLFGIATALPNGFYTRVELHNDALIAIEKSGETPALAADRDGWPSWLPSDLVNLGLDLRGGAHLLAEVQVQDVYKARIDSLWAGVREALKAERATIGGIKRDTRASPDILKFTIENPDGMTRALEVVRALATPVVTLTGAGSSDIDVQGVGNEITITLSEAEKLATDDRTMRTSLEIIRRRIDAVGTREPTIQRQGGNRILIEVPGIGSAEELKIIIGKTAKLTFHQVLGQARDINPPADIGQIKLPDADSPGLYYVLDEVPVISGDDLVDSQPDFDQNGKPAVSFKFNVTGARQFGIFTSEHINEPFAIVLDGKVISAPNIRQAITGGSGIIFGNFSIEESTNLAILLRSGALPADLTFLEERTIGPELGQDSVDAGKVAAVISLALVAGFMILSYGWFGVIANIALAMNIALIFGGLSLIGGTLTMPGIAAIVLTMGMAVDANVLIYERIRE
ncbi:MAG: protein translocase subunit SecD, partial [Deltaproteobacteria bacterium]